MGRRSYRSSVSSQYVPAAAEAESFHVAVRVADLLRQTLVPAVVTGGRGVALGEPIAFFAESLELDVGDGFSARRTLSFGTGSGLFEEMEQTIPARAIVVGAAEVTEFHRGSAARGPEAEGDRGGHCAHAYSWRALIAPF